MEVTSSFHLINRYSRPTAKILTALSSTPLCIGLFTNHFDAETNDIDIVCETQKTKDHEDRKFTSNPWLREFIAPLASFALAVGTCLNLGPQTNADAWRFLGCCGRGALLDGCHSGTKRDFFGHTYGVTLLGIEQLGVDSRWERYPLQMLRLGCRVGRNVNITQKCLHTLQNNSAPAPLAFAFDIVCVSLASLINRTLLF